MGTNKGKAKQILQPTQLCAPIASHQAHTSLPYFDEVDLYKLPSRNKSHWHCWTPAPQVSFLRSAKVIPCPPRITYGGVFQQRKAEQVPTSAASARRARKRKIIAGMPALKRAAHHHRGVQQRNKRQLNYLVPSTQRKSSVCAGKQKSMARLAKYYDIRAQRSYDSIPKCFCISRE